MNNANKWQRSSRSSDHSVCNTRLVNAETLRPTIEPAKQHQRCKQCYSSQSAPMPGWSAGCFLANSHINHRDPNGRWCIRY